MCKCMYTGFPADACFVQRALTSCFLHFVVFVVLPSVHDADPRFMLEMVDNTACLCLE